MKFPAICTLISTGKLVVCQDAGSFSNKSLVYGFAIGEEPVVPIFTINRNPTEAEEVIVTTIVGDDLILPPEKNSEEIIGFACSKCGKVCASLAGQKAHERKCNPTA